MMTSIDSTVQIYPEVKLGDVRRIGPFSVLGEPTRLEFQPNDSCSQDSQTVIRDGCYIGPHVLVYKGAKIKKDVTIERQGVIEPEAQVSQSSYLTYGAQVGAESEIGEQCVIGGFVAERTIVGNNSRIFGSLVHRHHKPHLEWDKNIEPSPVIGDNVIVAFNSSVVGEIEIGSNVFIGANALVTEDVPPETIVTGKNNKTPLEEWEGPLSDTPFLSDNDQ